MRSIQETAVYRGIGKYFVSLVRELNKIDKHNDYYLFMYPRQAEFAQQMLPHGEHWHFIHLPFNHWRHRKFIRTFALGHETLAIDKYALDVLFQLDILYPIKSTKTPIVSIVHDLIPFILKDEYQEPVKVEQRNYVGLVVYLKKKRISKLFNSSIHQHGRSDSVIAISGHTATDLHTMTNTSPAKTIVIPHGAETIPPGTKPVRPKTLPQGKPFIFYVGGVDPRKRIPMLIKQFAAISQDYSELLLVIAGKEATNMDVPQARKIKAVIKKLGLEKRIVLTGYVSDEELAYLYDKAEAFVLTSKYEGFGLQILEAYLAGCPVVAYGNSSIPEVAGDAALLVEEGQSLMPAVAKIIDGPILRKTLIEKGRLRASSFTWESTARQTLGVLESTARTKQ